ncbi:MAG: neutral/alkaline non-lysosomal ceramidase N-terminal domain-containing protein [Microthrixaceae bacterium]
MNDRVAADPQPHPVGHTPEGAAIATALDRFEGRASGRIHFSVRHRARTRPHVDGLLAGAARCDITPPPGMPKAGYSSNAHDGSGFRTRLRASVLYLRSGTTAIALVQCDLLGGSSVLQHCIADAVAPHTDVDLSGLMIGATHTHAGPGQFSGTDFYNRFASNRSGFDPAWTQFLVRRIAEAVVEAYRARRPALLAVGTTEVWGATRNRSLDPHLCNETVPDKRADAQRKFFNINPALHLLRVDDAHSGEPLGTAVVFSVHGTGISQHAREYNADLWSYLVDELGHHVESTRGRAGVIGAMQGTHADMAPALQPGRAGHPEAKRIGRRVGRAAADLYDRLGSSLSGSVALGAAFREIDLHGGASIDGVTLPDRPAVGAALVAGAAENLTPVVNHLPPFRAGFPKPFASHGPQGEKWVLGGRLQRYVLPLEAFPRTLPLQILRVGDTAIVGVPFEATLESGRRLASAAGRAMEGVAERIVVSSVANEYCGYVATAEEYRRQFYEGGHTIYGPNTQRFLAAHVGDLAARLAAAPTSMVVDAPEERHWSLHVHRYLALPEAAGTGETRSGRDGRRSTGRTGGRVGRSSLGAPRYVDATSDEQGYWEFRWRDAAPGDLVWHEPIVRLEQRQVARRAAPAAPGTPDPVLVDGSVASGSGGWVPAVHDGRTVDDQGTDVEVRLLGTDRLCWTYAARWHDPPFVDGVQHRFVVVGSGAAELTSPAFD